MKKLLLVPIAIAFCSAQASVWTSHWSLSEQWLYSTMVTLLPAALCLMIYADIS